MQRTGPFRLQSCLLRLCARLGPVRRLPIPGLLALVVALVSAPTRADDTEGLRVRLKAYFAATGDDARAKALSALESASVPRDQAARVRTLREALGLPARRAALRVEEPLGLTGAAA